MLYHITSLQQESNVLYDLNIDILPMSVGGGDTWRARDAAATVHVLPPGVQLVYVLHEDVVWRENVALRQNCCPCTYPETTGHQTVATEICDNTN